jgi:SAM-dependent methyltransferase
MTTAQARRRPDFAANTGATTVDDGEIARFDALAETWWDANGPMKPLHGMNPVRLGFIREQVITHFGLAASGVALLKGFTVADVGCGGGLLSEPLARMGAAVTGLDPAERNIGIARAHARQMELDIRYLPATIEALVELFSRALPNFMPSAPCQGLLTDRRGVDLVVLSALSFFLLLNGYQTLQLMRTRGRAGFCCTRCWSVR